MGYIKKEKIKKYNVTFTFVLFIVKNMRKLVCICIILVCISIVNAGDHIKKTKTNCVYKDKGICNLEDTWMSGWTFYGTKDMVPTSEIAARIAYVYVSSLYGEKIAKIEQPYHITLVDDSIWSIVGENQPRSKYKKWKGSFFLAIDRKTGKILKYMHEK